MKQVLRGLGVVLVLLAILFLILAVTSGPGGSGGKLTEKLIVKEHLIGGAYKVYGIEEGPAKLWLAKMVLTNETDGPVTDVKISYKVGEYADWCTPHVHAKIVPTQTVVDLYHPLLKQSVAGLSNRAPTELKAKVQYVDSAGEKQTLELSQRLIVLSRFEFHFTDVKSEEHTGSFQDSSTNAPLLAAWVTGKDAPVRRLAALANEAAKGAGAAIDDDNCIKVVHQLYEIMRRINITYQSPSYQLEKDKSFDPMLVQTLQYPRDTIEKRSGTCIDLAILMAAMMDSQGIASKLVMLDGHCFPIAVLPSGRYLPIEATCVGGGGRDSNNFVEAVKIASKQWAKLQQSGRFVLVDCQKCWAAGVSPPELPALPADILDRWKITEMLGAAGGGGATPPQPQPRPQPQPQPQPGGTGMVAGNWTFGVTQANGAILPGVAVVQRHGNGIQVVFGMQYQIQDAAGQPHQAQERNLFAGTVSGQAVQMSCTQAVWTLDGQAVQPQGLPYRMTLQVSADGRSARGTVANNSGQSQTVTLQAR